MNKTIAVVLAGGKGKRIQSEEFNMHKVMRLACGRPLLAYVLDALEFIGRDNIIIVTGYLRETVENAFPDYKFAFQEQQLGTGHAVMAARDYLAGWDGNVLVCYGDMPLIGSDVYKNLIAEHEKSGAVFTLLAGTSDINLAYGRVVRDENGGFLSIVEDRDCTPAQKLITELNSGVAVCDCRELLSALDGLNTDNAQGEYYFTDVPYIIKNRGGRVSVFTQPLGVAIMGVNSPEDLERIETLINDK